MTTINKRINITTDKNVRRALIYSAKRDGVTTAAKASELLRIALELEEDLVFAKVVNERLSEKNIKWVSHKNAWK